MGQLVVVRIKFLRVFPVAIALVASMWSASPVGASAPVVELAPATTWWHHTGISAPIKGHFGTQPLASPAVGDLRADGQMEVITAFPNGYVYAYSATGTLLPNWPRYTGGTVYGSPALADLRGDGLLEVVVASDNGWINAWNADGSNVTGWPQYAGYGAAHGNGFQPGFIAAPAIGDLFGNGQMDVVAASVDHYLYAWGPTGNLLGGFPINLWDTAVDTPALVDLNNTGQLDIVVGGDSIPINSPVGAYYAFPPTGCSSPNASLNSCSLWGGAKQIDDVPWSSPVAGDLFNTGNGTSNGAQKVVAGGGHFYFQTRGCGNSFCPPQVQGWNSDGSNVGGWPRGYRNGDPAMSSPVFGSVALGDLTNDGSNNRDVVAQAEGNQAGHGLYAWNPSGTPLAGFPAATPAVLDLASPAIAPVDGTTNGVWTSGGGVLYGLNPNGSIAHTITLSQVAGAGPSYLSYAAPTIVDLGGGSLSAVYTFTTSNFNDWYTAVTPIPGTTVENPNSWWTFHGNMQRSGGQVPIANVTAPTTGSPAQLTTDFPVSWATVANSVHATNYTLWVHEASLGWLQYINTPDPGTTFTGLAGHTYDFFVDAHNGLGSADLVKRAQQTVSIAAGALHSAPAPGFKGAYTVDRSGYLGSIQSPAIPVAAVYPGHDLIRGIALDATGQHGQLVDAYGGLHPIGDSTNYIGVSPANYYNGWDIIRGLALEPSGQGGYTVDAYGGLHAFGDAPSISLPSTWGGRDLAKGVVLLPTSDGPGGHNGGYVLDAYGGIHPFGTAPYYEASGYYSGWNVIRGIALDSDGLGGYTVDAFGGLHQFGNAPWRGSGSAYYPGWDIIRGVGVTNVVPGGAGNGYTLDQFGGLHTFGTSPPLAATHYMLTGGSEGIAIS